MKDFIAYVKGELLFLRAFLMGERYQRNPDTILKAYQHARREGLDRSTSWRAVQQWLEFGKRGEI